MFIFFIRKLRTIVLTLVLILISYGSGIAQIKVDSTRIVRVLSFNIYHGETVNAKQKFDLDLLAKIINDVEPDVVALQEVDFKTERARNYDLVTELGQRTEMAGIFGKAMPFDGGEYGEGVLSKYSFLTTQNHPLKARKDKEPRTAMAIDIELRSGDRVRFIGTHLDHTTDETDRINQANQLNELFTKDDLPTILAGDLNARPESKTMKILFKEWTPSDPEFVATAPSDDPRAKIDYVLFRPIHKWRVLETQVICNEKATDHCVVLSVLELLD